MPEQLIKFYWGHEMKTDITDRYSKVFQNEALRKSWTLKAGLGFELPQLCKPGHPTPKSSITVVPSKSTTLEKSAASAKAESIAVQHVVPYQAIDDDLSIELFENPTEPSSPRQER